MVSYIAIKIDEFDTCNIMTIKKLAQKYITTSFHSYKGQKQAKLNYVI